MTHDVFGLPEGLVTCKNSRGLHGEGHYQLPGCINPTPLYRKTHVCEFVTVCTVCGVAK